jgi:hypothetical protein
MNASRSSVSSFMVNTASLDMTGLAEGGMNEACTTSVFGAVLFWAMRT